MLEIKTPIAYECKKCGFTWHRTKAGEPPYCSKCKGNWRLPKQQRGRKPKIVEQAPQEVSNEVIL